MRLLHPEFLSNFLPNPLNIELHFIWPKRTLYVNALLGCVFSIICILFPQSILDRCLSFNLLPFSAWNIPSNHGVNSILHKIIFIAALISTCILLTWVLFIHTETAVHTTAGYIRSKVMFSKSGFMLPKTSQQVYIAYLFLRVF